MRRFLLPLIVLGLGFAPAPVFRPKPTGDDRARLQRTITTASGLKYQDLKVGTGEVAKKGDKLLVHYTGWLAKNQIQFDSSVGKKPFEFELGSGKVIKGWDEGMVGMKAGGKRKLTLHAELGYGATGAGGVIPPGADLIFEVELLEHSK